MIIPRTIKVMIFWLASLSILCAIAWIDVSVCVDKGRRYNMEYLAQGIIHFNASHRRLPTSIEDLTADKFFPSKSDMYACPLKHGRFFLLPMLQLTNMEYDIVFSETNVVIRYRQDVRHLLKHIVRDGGLQDLEIMVKPNDQVMEVSNP
jgi:hypothetical protein